MSGEQGGLAGEVRAIVAMLRALEAGEAERLGRLIRVEPSHQGRAEGVGAGFEAALLLCREDSDDDALRGLAVLWEASGGFAEAFRDRAERALVELCSVERGAEVCARALRMLGGRGHRSRYLGVYLEMLGHPAAEARSAAVEVLGWFHGHRPDPLAGGALAGALADREPAVRVMAVRSLERARVDGAPQLLLKASGDPSPAVRRAAVQGLYDFCVVHDEARNSIHRHPWAAEHGGAVFGTLAGLAQEDPDAGVRAVAVDLLSLLARVSGEGERVAALLRPLHGVEDVVLRACVVANAAILGDVAARALLRAELDRPDTDRAYLRYAVSVPFFEDDLPGVVSRLASGGWAQLPDREGRTAEWRRGFLRDLSKELRERDREFMPVRPPTVHAD